MTAGRMTYDLRRLRLHGLIERVPHTHRYQVTPFGLQVAIFFTRTYSRLLRTGLAQIRDPLPVNTPLRRHFDRLEAAINHLHRRTQPRRLKLDSSVPASPARDL